MTTCKKGRRNGTVTTPVGWGQEGGKERKKEESYMAAVVIHIGAA